MLGVGVGVPMTMTVGIGPVGVGWGAKGLGKTLVKINVATMPTIASARVASPQLTRGRRIFHPLEAGEGEETGRGVACALEGGLVAMSCVLAELHSSTRVTLLLSITWSPTVRACGPVILTPLTVTPFALSRSSMVNHSS